MITLYGNTIWGTIYVIALSAAFVVAKKQVMKQGKPAYIEFDRKSYYHEP